MSPTGNDANTGTAAQPFATIQHAITASADGDSVMLADGEYSGSGNRDIDMLGKAIRVASISMDPGCVLSTARIRIRLRTSGSSSAATTMTGPSSPV
ncbi:MAG: DUF1565 domain-containing protein [bacterium]|nr:DUF1565 domain-containing protein [bacterium]